MHQANIGLAPWEAFGIGVSYVTGLTYGRSMFEWAFDFSSDSCYG
ncbi:MAG: hypothetical protein ACLR2G_03410 [Phascolarctobacterium faecium]